MLSILCMDRSLQKGDIYNMSRVTTKPNLSSGFQTRSDTNWAVQPQKMGRGLKFQI